MHLHRYAVLLLATPLLVACGSTPGAQEVPDCSSGGNLATGCPTTVQYKGRDLNCLSWGEYGGGTGLTCDYVEYYQRYGSDKVTASLESWTDEELEEFYDLYSERRSQQ